MNLDSLKRKSLLEWAFAWNQARLIIAGATLILAKKSPILTYFGIPLVTPLAGTLMPLAWLLSGVVSVYLIYVWYNSGQTVFGGKEKIDLIAFWVATITGINLGFAAISTNVGFAITPAFLSTPAMILAGLLYFWTAYHMHSRGGVNQLFTSQTNTQPEPSAELTDKDKQG
jgi:hypothetical protein